MRNRLNWIGVAALLCAAACSNHRVEVESTPDSGLAQDGGADAGDGGADAGNSEDAGLGPCGADAGACSASAICQVQQGVANCECPAGFIGNGLFGGALQCVDPCSQNHGNCGANSVCALDAGAVECSCAPGFVAQGGACVDSCTLNNGGCSANAVCQLSSGVAVCGCPAGYISNGQFGGALFCSSPCTVRNGGCDPNASCTFASGAVACACNGGFDGNGESGTALSCALPPDGGAGPDAGPIDAGPVACGEAGQPCCAGGGCVANGQLACNLGECMFDANWTHWAGSSGDSSVSQYVVSADGSTVTDSVTGLVWQASYPGGEAPASEQIGCAILNLGAYPSGWRVPTIIEAISLLDFAPAGAAPPFPQFGASPYGIDTATLSADAPNQRWGAIPLHMLWKWPSEYNTTLCVHDTQGVGFVGHGPGAPAGRYVVNGDGPSGTVYDTVSQLTWQQRPPAGGYTWSSSAAPGSAQAYCAGLSLGGHASGWRVPSLKELASLVDFETSNPAIDASAFQRAESTGIGIYWTTAVYSDAPNNLTFAVAIDFFEGGQRSTEPDTQLLVRCVR